MVADVKITLKNDEEGEKFNKTFTSYDPFTASWDDPFIQECLRECKTKFKLAIDDCKVRIDLLPDPMDKIKDPTSRVLYKAAKKGIDL